MCGNVGAVKTAMAKNRQDADVSSVWPQVQKTTNGAARWAQLAFRDNVCVMSWGVKEDKTQLNNVVEKQNLKRLTEEPLQLVR